MKFIFTQYVEEIIIKTTNKFPTKSHIITS